MAGLIRAADIDEIKARVNIADVIGEYVSLKTASVGSLKGLCPFHDEKSPSFNVRPAQGFYHCFGCGEGGDVYKFLQRMESISFTEAVEKLAAKVGYQINYEEGSASPDSAFRGRILEANAAAAKFYQEKLNSDEAIAGRDFLKGRGFDRQAAEQFGVGYAPKAWSELYSALTAQGFTLDELLAAGLVTKSDRGAYDKFRGRLIWPIRDTSAQVIGFGARKLYEDDTGPKYLNTSDTPVYHKSQVLYGIDLAKQSITKQQQVVVVEGYTDVMACHLSGIQTAVATCGTAFGDDHIRILNRMLSRDGAKPAEVIFTFDPDAAGQKAAMRAFSDSSKFFAQTYVAVGPDGLDPCDLRLSRGNDAVQAMIANKKPLFEFAIRQRISVFDLSSLEGKVRAARTAAPIVADLSDSAMRTEYTRTLAGLVALDVVEVEKMVREAAADKRAADVRPNSIGEFGGRNAQSTPSDASAVQSSGSTDPGGGGSPALPAVNLGNPISRFERQLLEVLVQVPRSISVDDARSILDGGFTEPVHSALANALMASLDKYEGFDWLSELTQNTPPSLQATLREIAATPLPATDELELLRYCRGVAARAFSKVLAQQKAELLAELRRLDPENEPEKYQQVQRSLVAIETKRRSLE